MVLVHFFLSIDIEIKVPGDAGHLKILLARIPTKDLSIISEKIVSDYRRVFKVKMILLDVFICAVIVMVYFTSRRVLSWRDNCFAIAMDNTNPRNADSGMSLALNVFMTARNNGK